MTPEVQGKIMLSLKFNHICKFCAFYGQKTKHKHQIPNKFEIQNFNDQNLLAGNRKEKREKRIRETTDKHRHVEK
ncbi:MAG: hypothetical protein OEM90_06125 [Desulfobacteraceae bacterium]|nr:hypothetical protein [Desulfobacteraceae bacterium]